MRVNRRWLRLTAIVAEREFRQRGASRAFAVSTIVLLLVVGAGVTIPAILAHHANLTGTGVTVVPEPSLAGAEAALRSGQLDVVLVNDTEVVVKQVSLAAGSGGTLPSAIADVAGLTKLVGQLPPGAAASGVTLPVRGLTPPSASLSRRLTGLFTTARRSRWASARRSPTGSWR